MATPEEGAKTAAIDAMQIAVDTIRQTLEELRKLEKANQAFTPALLQITRRISDAASELFDQQTLLAHLKAESIRVNPLSQSSRDVLARALERLNRFVQADQAFHDRLEAAEVVIGLINDHEKEIQQLIK